MATLEMTCDSLDEGIGYVRLIGRLDIPGVQEIDLKFTTCTSTRRKPVIVDLSDVTLITSMGLGMIITNARSLRVQNVPMVLLRPVPQVEKVIKMSGLDEILFIEHDFETAIKKIKEASVL
jgi:stage II sporulation protein AA (anti-sigma F factor antagonist)